MKAFIQKLLFGCLLLLATAPRAAAQDTDSAATIGSALASSQDSLKLSTLHADVKDKQEHIAQTITNVQTESNELNRILEARSKGAKDIVEIQDKISRLNAAFKAQKDSLQNLVQSTNDAQKEAAKQLVQKMEAEQEIVKLKAAAANISKNIDSSKSELATKTAQLAELRDSLEVAGVLEMRTNVKMRRDSTIVRMKNGKIVMRRNTADSTTTGVTNRKDLLLTINSVYIKVQEGVILEVNVNTTGGIFRNKNSVFDFLHYDRYGDQKLYFVNQNYRADRKVIFLYLDDVLKYTPVGSFQELPYTDFDATLTNDSLHPGKRNYEIKESTSLNTYFNVAAFTDLKGIGGEPNALIQFNASAKFITRTKSFRNSAVVPFHFVSFQASVAKFDNDFKGSEVYHEDSVSRRDLLQRARYTIGAKMNLLRGMPSPTPKHLFSDWQVNLGANFMSAQVFDTFFRDEARTVIDTSFKGVTTIQTYVEPILSLSRRKNFSMTLMCPIYMNVVTASARLDNDHAEFWAVPGISLSYFGKRESGNKLFFRYNYSFNIRKTSEAFTQLQLGYSVNISDLLGGSK